MPSFIVERANGTFGARIPKRRGGMKWLGTRATREDAEALVAAARRPRERRRCETRDVVPPSMDEVLAAARAAATLPLRAFILVAAFSGLRLFEVAALQVRDVDLAGHEVHVRDGKFGYERTSVLYGPARLVLEELLISSGKTGTDLIWETARGNRWSRQFVSKAWIRTRALVGVDCTFHALRHFHACWLLDTGASDMDVSIQLGHHDNGEEVRRRYGRHRSEQAARLRLKSLGEG